MRSLPSWAHNAKYCRDLGEKTQGSCSDELPPPAAISEALLESACVVYTNHVWLREGMRASESGAPPSYWLLSENKRLDSCCLQVSSLQPRPPFL